MKDKILVIGGYGNVGQTICHELSTHYPNLVIAAGRDIAKAQALAQTLPVIPMSLDILSTDNSSISDKLKDVGTVVMCLDQKDTRLVETCLSQGIHYIDVSAHYPFLKQLKGFHNLAQNSHSTAILNVGLAPGLSTLLAAHCTKLMEKVYNIDISILLGSGDTHGVAAMLWTLEHLLGATLEGRAKMIDYGKGWGTRLAMPLDFSDQWTLRETLKIPDVWTRFSMDSKIYTRLLSLVQKHLPKGRARDYLKSENFARWMVSQKKGSDVFILKVDVQGIRLGKPHHASYTLSGHREGIITGKVAATVTRQLLESPDQEHGVFYIDEYFSFEDILKHIQNPNLRIESIELTPLAV